tara:strand:+ start:239 stop:457 length:219 start_codon:yes stop_codon:yes gene_type:complete
MKKTTLRSLVKDINAKNAPPGGWSPKDRVQDKPEPGKVYALTGGPGSRCIANGNSWTESEVSPEQQDPGEAT